MGWTEDPGSIRHQTREHEGGMQGNSISYFYAKNRRPNFTKSYTDTSDVRKSSEATKPYQRFHNRAHYLPPSQSLMAASSSYFTVRGWWLVARLGLGTQLLAIHQLTTSSPAEFDPVQVAPCLCGGRRTFCNKFAHFGGSKHLKHNTGVDTCLAGRGAENNMIYRPAFCKNNKAIKHGRWRKLHKELDIY